MQQASASARSFIASESENGITRWFCRVATKQRDKSVVTIDMGRFEPHEWGSKSEKTAHG